MSQPSMNRLLTLHRHTHFSEKWTKIAAIIAIIAASLLTLSLLSSCSPRKNASLKQIKITITPLMSYAPLFIAQEEGYFKAQGLEVEFIRLNHSSEAIPSLDRGDLDIVGGSISMGVLNAIARGARIRVVADKGSVPPSGCHANGFVIRRGLAARIPVEKPELLRGLKVAVNPVSTSGYMLDQILEKAGMTLDDVVVTSLPNSIMPEALKNGSIDLAEVDEPHLTHILESGSSVIWYNSDKYFPEYQMAVLLFGTNLLDKDSAAGERFMTAYLQGVKQFRKGKTDRNIEILSGATNLSRIQLEKICWPYIRENGEPHLKSLMDYQAWGVRKGLIKSPLDMNQIWDGRFIESAHRNSGAQGR